MGHIIAFIQYCLMFGLLKAASVSKGAFLLLGYMVESAVYYRILIRAIYPSVRRSIHSV